jgi:hypothetical protein
MINLERLGKALREAFVTEDVRLAEDGVHRMYVGYQMARIRKLDAAYETVQRRALEEARAQEKEETREEEGGGDGEESEASDEEDVVITVVRPFAPLPHGPNGEYLHLECDEIQIDIRNGHEQHSPKCEGQTLNIALDDGTVTLPCDDETCDIHPRGSTDRLVSNSWETFFKALGFVDVRGNIIVNNYQRSNRPIPKALENLFKSGVYINVRNITVNNYNCEDGGLGGRSPLKRPRVE